MKCLALFLVLHTGWAILSMNIEKRHLEHPLLDRHKRDVSPLTVAQNFSVYTTNVTLGDDDQILQVVIDTGSSDLWVMDRGNPYCEGTPNNDTSLNQINCSDVAFFDPETSSTFSYLQNLSSFYILYGEGSFASGRYASDIMTIGNKTINCTFGLAMSGNTTEAVFGIGLPRTESSVKYYDNGVFSPTYPNIPYVLKYNGLIERVAYSIWLNGQDTSKGAVIFGGISSNLYTGNITKVPMVSDGTYPVVSSLSVMLHGIGVYEGVASSPNVNASQLVEFSRPALLDTGTTYSFLPPQVISIIAATVNATQDNTGSYIMNCNMDGGTILNFSGIQILVPFSSISVPKANTSSCELALLPTWSRIILGDNILRSLYLVFDLESLEVGLAPTVASFIDSVDEEEEISSDGLYMAEAPFYSSTSTATTYVTHTIDYMPLSDFSESTYTSSTTGELSSTRNLAHPKPRVPGFFYALSCIVNHLI